MVDGSSSLVIPLMKIVNKSVRTGMFPSKWKEATVTPILKRGDKENLSN